jgi:hypothetical protein
MTWIDSTGNVRGQTPYPRRLSHSNPRPVIAPTPDGFVVMQWGDDVSLFDEDTLAYARVGPNPEPVRWQSVDSLSSKGDAAAVPVRGPDGLVRAFVTTSGDGCVATAMSSQYTSTSLDEMFSGTPKSRSG